MKSLTRLVIVLSVLALSGAWTGLALSQNAQPPAREGGADRQRGGNAPNREDWRQRMADRVKEMLGATDDEWKVIQPRLQKVQTLQMQVRLGGMMGGMMMGGRGGRGPGGDAAQPQHDISKAAQDLRSTLDDKTANPDTIKTKLQALREAKEKVQKELAKAQQDLREILTVNQEAQLVLMGVLD